MRRLLAAVLSIACTSAYAVECGEVLVADTVLDRDLHCPGVESALVVGRSGIRIDLGGHTLSGDARGTGILIEDAHRVAIAGPGRLSGFQVGIEATRSHGLAVRGLGFEGIGDGVRLHNASESAIVGNRFEGVAGHAIAVLSLPGALTRGGGHEIRDNAFADSEYGVLLDGHDSGASAIVGNRFDAMGTFAIQVDRWAARNRIEDNEIGDVGLAPVAYTGW